MKQTEVPDFGNLILMEEAVIRARLCCFRNVLWQELKECKGREDHGQKCLLCWRKMASLMRPHENRLQLSLEPRFPRNFSSLGKSIPERRTCKGSEAKAHQLWLSIQNTARRSRGRTKGEVDVLTELGDAHLTFCGTRAKANGDLCDSISVIQKLQMEPIYS